MSEEKSHGRKWREAIMFLLMFQGLAFIGGFAFAYGVKHAGGLCVINLAADHVEVVSHAAP